MHNLADWERHPDRYAAFKYRQSHVKGTGFETVVLAVKFPGQRWLDFCGKRSSAEDARRSLLAKGYVFVHRSRCRDAALSTFTELWLPIHLTDRHGYSRA